MSRLAEPGVLRALGASIALIGLALLAAGALADPERAAFAYLVAYVFGLSLVLGSLFWVMIQHLTGAFWFIVLRGIAERIFRPLPLFALLFLPILASLHWLYSWTDPERISDPAVREDVMAKLAYLNPSFFGVRAGLYFAIWIVCAVGLRHWSSQQITRQIEASRTSRLAAYQRVLSGAGLPAAGFALYFAAVDWLMSLEPSWASSMFGVYVFAGTALGALSLLIVVTVWLDRRGTLGGMVTVSHYHALGKLLFTILVFWAYTSYFQYFLIWIANVPDEARWYVPRTEEAFMPLAIVLLIGHFVVPFFLLLSRELRRTPRALAAVAGWLLIMHYLDTYWIVIPALGPRAAPHWLDAAALAGVLGLFFVFGLAGARAETLAVAGDPRFERALHFETR